MSLERADYWRAIRAGLEVALAVAEEREREELADEVSARAPGLPGDSLKLMQYSIYGRERPPLYLRVEEVRGFRHETQGTVGVLVCREYRPGTDLLGSQIITVSESNWPHLSKAVPVVNAFHKKRRKKRCN